MPLTFVVMKCANCNATLSENAGWCPQCFTPVDVEPPQEPESPPAPEAGEPRIFAHPDSTRPPLHPEWSRWQKSSTTFGPFGRIVASLGLLIPLFFFFYAGVIGFVGVVMWVGIVMPMALRSIWARGRVVRDESEG